MVNEGEHKIQLLNKRKDVFIFTSRQLLSRQTTVTFTLFFFALKLRNCLRLGIQLKIEVNPVCCKDSVSKCIQK